MMHQLVDLWFRGWRSLVEILLLSVAIYYGYLYFRGTRGAKVLTGLAIVCLTLTLISTLLNLVVIGWIVRSFSVFLAVALVRGQCRPLGFHAPRVRFQPLLDFGYVFGEGRDLVLETGDLAIKRLKTQRQSKFLQHQTRILACALP